MILSMVLLMINEERYFITFVNNEIRTL